MFFKRWLFKSLTVLLLVMLIIGLIVYSILMPPTLKFPKISSHTLSGLTVYNPNQEVIPNQTLVIQDGIIVDIRETKPSDPAPICAGCYVMPGLIDAHVHTPPSIAFGNQKLFSLLYLKHGVTSVRDMGQSDDTISKFARLQNLNKILGPRMYRCGPVIDGDPPGWPSAQMVTTQAGAIALVQKLAKEGVDCIKIYNEISPSVYDGITTEATKIGLPVIGHVPHSIGLKGVTNFESQHLTGVPYLNGGRPKIGRDFKSADFLKLTEGDIAAVIEISKRQNIAYTPTLSNLELRLVASDSQRFKKPEGAKDMPKFWNSIWGSVAGFPVSEVEIQERIGLIEVANNFTGFAHAQGVDILAGTDTIMPWVAPGDALHKEIYMLAQAFGSTEQAISAATIINGSYIDAGKIGVVKIGAYADLLILKQDPRDSLKEIKNWTFLVKDGHMIDRPAFDRMDNRYHRHFHSVGYELIMGIAMALTVSDYVHKEE